MRPELCTSGILIEGYLSEYDRNQFFAAQEAEKLMCWKRREPLLHVRNHRKVSGEGNSAESAVPRMRAGHGMGWGLCPLFSGLRAGAGLRMPSLGASLLCVLIAIASLS